MGIPDGSTGKESACNVGNLGFNPWVGKIPWRRQRLPTPVFWPREFQGLYSSWGHKGLDTAEWLSLSFSKKDSLLKHFNYPLFYFIFQNFFMLSHMSHLSLFISLTVLSVLFFNLLILFINLFLTVFFIGL